MKANAVHVLQKHNARAASSGFRAGPTRTRSALCAMKAPSNQLAIRLHRALYGAPRVLQGTNKCSHLMLPRTVFASPACLGFTVVPPRIQVPVPVIRTVIQRRAPLTERAQQVSTGVAVAHPKTGIVSRRPQQRSQLRRKLQLPSLHEQSPPQPDPAQPKRTLERPQPLWILKMSMLRLLSRLTGLPASNCRIL